MSGIINSAGSKSGVIGQTELDYEEGTFTPVMSGTGYGSGGALDFGTGIYTKIGRMVTAHVSGGDVTLPDYTGTLYCSLPFTSASAGSWRSPDPWFWPNSAWDGVSNFNGFVAYLPNNTNLCHFNIKIMDGDRQTDILSTNSATEDAAVYLSFQLTYMSA